MDKRSWDEIETIYALPRVNPITIEGFQQLKRKQVSYTRSEGNVEHYCSFFLPFDSATGKIYLGDHIKAAGWIPPGGHIEPGETPKMTVIREMQEELGVTIAESMIEPFDLSIALIHNAKGGCMTHYDIWHLIHITEQDFAFDRNEYYDASWFSLANGVKKMTMHPIFAAIVAKLA